MKGRGREAGKDRQVGRKDGGWMFPARLTSGGTPRDSVVSVLAKEDQGGTEAVLLRIAEGRIKKRIMG